MSEYRITEKSGLSKFLEVNVWVLYVDMHSSVYMFAGAQLDVHQNKISNNIDVYSTPLLPFFLNTRLSS